MIVESYEDVIVLSGTLYAHFWEAVQTAIALTIRRHPTGVIIDCKNITGINEEGAKTFQEAIDYVLEHEARIIFVGVSPEVMKVLNETPAVRSQLATAATIEEARKSLDLFENPEKRKKRRTSAEARSRHILAVVCPDDCEPGFIRMLTEYVRPTPAHVVILFPVVVPRELPLHAAVPEVEHRLQKYAEDARQAFDHSDSDVEVRLERTRDIPTLVEEMAKEIGAQQVVVSISADPEDHEESRNNFDAILQSIDLPLIFVRAARSGSSEV